MNTPPYLTTFQKASDQLDKELLGKKNLQVAVGVVLDSVFLKLYKPTWTSPLQDPLTAESRIFFSIWVNDSTLKEEKVFYNVHALKLRKLKGYAIESRKFAEAFRKDFDRYRHQWENVRTDFGPLTLMEGWIRYDPEQIQKNIVELASNFLTIEHLIDKTLLQFKK